MANLYRATNILTGETKEGSAHDLANELFTNETNIYNAKCEGSLLDRKWKVTLVKPIYYVKKCETCGCTFKTKVKNQMFCTKKCQSVNNGEPYTPQKMEGYKKRSKILDDFALEATNAGTSYGKYEGQKWAKEHVKIERKWQS